MKMIVWFLFVLGALSAVAEVFIAKVGEKVTLKCGDNIDSVVWRRGNELLFNVNKRGFTRKGTVELVGRSVVRNANLEISGVRETDAGKFTCSAEGRDQEHSLVVVSVSVSVTPSAVLQLGSEATLQCDVKGLVEGYKVKWESPHGGSSESSLTAQLKPVTRLHEGTWQCVVTYGSYQLSESLAITVKEPLTPTKQPSKPNGNTIDSTLCPTCANKAASPGLLGLPWWVWVAIGFGCLVVILLMVCVIVLCMRVRRRRRKFLKMKTAQQRQRPKKYCQCDHPTAAAKPKQGRRREKPSALPLYSI